MSKIACCECGSASIELKLNPTPVIFCHECRKSFTARTYFVPEEEEGEFNKQRIMSEIGALMESLDCEVKPAGPLHREIVTPDGHGYYIAVVRKS